MIRLLLFFIFIKGSFSLTLEDVRNVTSSVPEGGKLWALLVAGSYTWDNYRHQADVCHAYQVLHNHGISDEQIVVMMYNDIAYNTINPTPGVVINHPYGHDVYKGVPHDYIKDDVKPSNFFNILRGNEKAMRNIGSGKVIKSGPKDHVFVYYADHGAYGLICFPAAFSQNDDTDGYITSEDLTSFLNKFYEEKKFGKMVLYIEACESGSMFLNLTNNINVFATTAADKDESSYACYFDDKRETYLGDVYSVKWMEDSDKEVISKETLEKQYKIVKEETNTSTVEQFGDLKIATLPVSEFQGRKKAKQINYPKVSFDAVPSRDVSLEILKRKISKTNSSQKRRSLIKELHKLMRNREFADYTIKKIIKLISSDDDMYNRIHMRPEGTNFDCYKEVLKYFNKKCFNISKNEYVLSHLYKFANICQENVPVKRIKEVIEIVCIDHLHGD